MALVLSLVLLVTTACGQRPSPSGSPPMAGPASQPPGGALQEVAPPGAVQQLNGGLNERAPRVEVLAPADNSVLPEGPWTLQLKVQDWPLADAGPLGLGPHVVVQLDDAPPIRLSSPDALAAVPMPELRPGSHRVTVYAARPWGEAVKAPGATRQLRLHRVSRNAAALPAPGSAQLIAVSPDGQVPGEPVLLDWLLLDAPLQHLRGDDAQWRLRISVNGDSFLVDRQTPLWLKGFKRGSNAVQLELLDGRGDPLNPPFNSLVREVVIGGGNRPAWLKPSLSPDELARLSGEAPPEPEPQAEPEPKPEPAPKPEPQPTPVPAAGQPSAPEPELEAEAKPEPEPAMAAKTAKTAEPDEPVEDPAAAKAVQEPEQEPVQQPKPEVEDEAKPEAATENLPEIAAQNGADSESDRNEAERAEGPHTQNTAVATSRSNPVASPDVSAGSSPEPNVDLPTPPQPVAPLERPSASATNSERMAPTTSLVGSAREQVSANGSLLQPKPRGPLAGLREKLGG